LRFGIFEQMRKNGAGERIRTADRLITNQLLYQLSYASIASKLDPSRLDGGGIVRKLFSSRNDENLNQSISHIFGHLAQARSNFGRFFQ
jgi:hypothetical protein